MRKVLFDIIDEQDKHRYSDTYDIGMLVVMFVSIIPLFFKEELVIFRFIDYLTTGLFMVDYALRLVTADFKIRRGPKSFLIYPFTFLAVIDLICILPTLLLLNPSLKLLRVLRFIRLLRIFKVIRHSENIMILSRVLEKQKSALFLVAGLAMGYTFFVALLIFSAEPETFNTFFDALYWSTISLTTVGYGDIFPVSVLGKVITMISSMVGIAIVALPSGIITAGYMKEIKDRE